MEAILNVPGLNKLRDLPFMRAVLTPPVSLESVSLVAVATAIGLYPDPKVNNDKYNGDQGIISAVDISSLAR